MKSRISFITTLCLLFLILMPFMAYADTGETSTSSPKPSDLADNEKKEKSAQPEMKINWSASYDEAKETADRDKKKLFINVFASWSGWCKKMDKETFADKNIIESLAGFSCYKISAEDDEAFVSKFNVKEFPTIIILKADGGEIERATGFKTAKELAKFLKETSSKTN